MITVHGHIVLTYRAITKDLLTDIQANLFSIPCSLIASKVRTARLLEIVIIPTPVGNSMKIPIGQKRLPAKLVIDKAYSRIQP
ncbi:hypothetical protein [Rubritalea tangerina]|uniref:hypothetical protein n=1 Tax=Rubritalea tangerina TaxID=430798 RepID=UPI0036216A1B